MAMLGGVMVTLVNFLITLNNLAALILVRGTDFLSVFDKSQWDALMASARTVVVRPRTRVRLR